MQSLLPALLDSLKGYSKKFCVKNQNRVSYSKILSPHKMQNWNTFKMSCFVRIGSFCNLDYSLETSYLESSSRNQREREMYAFESFIWSVLIFWPFNVLWSLQTPLNIAHIASGVLGLSTHFNHIAVIWTLGTAVLDSWVYICMWKNKLGLCLCKILYTIIYRCTS